MLDVFGIGVFETLIKCGFSYNTDSYELKSSVDDKVIWDSVIDYWEFQIWNNSFNKYLSSFEL